MRAWISVPACGAAGCLASASSSPGTYLFFGLALFGTFTAAPPLSMAALAFTAYGVHWLATGRNRRRQAGPRTNVGMAIAFTVISVLGIVVSGQAADHPVVGLFIGLTCIYVAGIVKAGHPVAGLFPPGHRHL